jgi:hypothetical protein
MTLVCLSLMDQDLFKSVGSLLISNIELLTPCTASSTIKHQHSAGCALKLTPTMYLLSSDRILPCQQQPIDTSTGAVGRVSCLWNASQRHHQRQSISQHARGAQKVLVCKRFDALVGRQSIATVGGAEPTA